MTFRSEPALEAVTDAQIQSFLPLIERLARQMSGWASAEFDDLRQEGMIAVWLAFQRGQAPTEEIVTWRMRNWIRKVGRQRRLEEPVADDDDFGEGTS